MLPNIRISDVRTPPPASRGERLSFIQSVASRQGMLQSSGFSHMLKVIWYQVPLSHRQWVSLPVQLQCLALQLHSVHGCCAVLCSAVLCCAMQCCAVLCCAAQCCAHPRVRCTEVACHLQQHTAEDSARLSTGCISVHTMRLAGCCPALL